MTPEAYLDAHPGALTVSMAAMGAFDRKMKGRRRTVAPEVTELTRDLIGVVCRIDHGIRLRDCLPLPWGYAFPTKGKARTAYQRALLALAKKRPVFIWGGPGTGKDAVVHAYSTYTRTPAFVYTFTPGTEVKRWFYSREITEAGTDWSYGTLWNAIVNGVLGTDGVARPALILFSDVDRGTPEQIEEFRLTLDTTSKRIVGPTGEVHTLFPGTQFAFTANSCGTGDETGRMSSQRMDASILDRMGRFVEFTHMHWDDESAILRSKFPTLVEAAPDLIQHLGWATDKIRAAIESEELYAEFTHRGLCEVLAECDDVLWLSDGTAPANLLKRGFSAWLHRLDKDSRTIAMRLIDAVVPGGLFTDEERN
jgi:MoxR-like ATPase